MLTSAGDNAIFASGDNTTPRNACPTFMVCKYPPRDNLAPVHLLESHCPKSHMYKGMGKSLLSRAAFSNACFLLFRPDFVVVLRPPLLPLAMVCVRCCWLYFFHSLSCAKGFGLVRETPSRQKRCVFTPLKSTEEQQKALYVQTKGFSTAVAHKFARLYSCTQLRGLSGVWAPKKMCDSMSL